MANYRKMYFLLFNKITDTIKDLQQIQQQVEEMYIMQEENIILTQLIKNEEEK